MNFELLEEMVEQGFIYKKKHPTANLFIYNYSQKAQYERAWNEATLSARGLILDSNMNIVAKPFGKFFNLGEHKPEEIPLLPYEVFEKMDGSLGILYWIEDDPFIATRGSFESDQAKHATKILYNEYSHLFDRIDRESTNLFEIIYPENRIVVDYKGLDDLILLTIIDNKTGEERLDDIGFKLVKQHFFKTEEYRLHYTKFGLSCLDKLEEDNKEGFVVRFKNNFRIKVKFAEYVRLHRIMTNISNVVIWEYLSQGRPLAELIENVPDEFYEYVKATSKGLQDSFDSILEECQQVFKVLDSRKATALYFQKQIYPHVLFCLLDNKKPDKLIWKLVRPNYSKPFKEII